MNLVLIETSGNQRYIYATNKLRENVGASELTFRVGTQFVLEAVEAVTKLKIYEDDDLDGRMMRANLLDKTKNPELGSNGNQVEVIIATSGKALLLVDEKETGKKIVKAVTERALREMPGLTVHGAISEDFGNLITNNFSGIHEAVVQVHHRLEQIRYEMPGNDQRFLRLPYCAPCQTSGLPAQTKDKEGTEEILVSTLSKTKRDNIHAGQQRLEAIVHGVSNNMSLIKSVEELERRFKELSWVAVVHADGNGLGEIFLNFDKHTGLKAGTSSPREYITKYRRFSLALDVCTINAAGHALQALQERFRKESEKNVGKDVPVVPLILGGDDLTVLCDGQYAIKFVYEFLREFEKETNKITDHVYLKEDRQKNLLVIEGKTVYEILTGIVPEIANNAFGQNCLGICAGVAIAKPHFPFHQGYELAEHLLKSAKLVKEKIKRRHNNKEVPHPCSALDYHILYDSTASRLEDIRDRMKSDSQTTWLYARPYVVSDFNDDYPANDWLTPRKWEELDRRVAAMLARDKEDENKRRLPNSQLHSLREALFQGKAEADARARLINHRYKDQGFDHLLWDTKTETLFFAEQHDSVDGQTTHFLDALDVVDFRKGEKEENGKLVNK